MAALLFSLLAMNLITLYILMGEEKVNLILCWHFHAKIQLLIDIKQDKRMQIQTAVCNLIASIIEQRSLCDYITITRFILTAIHPKFVSKERQKYIETIFREKNEYFSFIPRLSRVMNNFTHLYCMPPAVALLCVIM